MRRWENVKYPLAEAWLSYMDTRTDARIDMRQVVRINRYRVYKGIPSIWL